MKKSQLDYFDDKDLVTLTKIASRLPKDIFDDALPTKEDVLSLNDEDFALSIITKTAEKLNKFPINNRLNTILSNEYFSQNMGQLPSDAQKIAAVHIKNACKRFDIGPSPRVKVASINVDVDTNIYVEKDYPGQVMTKKATMENSFALPSQTRYPLRNVDMVKKAEAYFDQHYRAFTPEERNEYAVNVSKRSQELGVKLASATLRKYASSTYNPDLESHLSSRRKLLDSDCVYHKALEKLGSYRNTVDAQTFATVLHEIDKKAGLEKYYDKYIQDPFSSTFGIAKTASYIYEKDGIYLTEKDIAKCATNKYDILKNYFGQSLADGLKKEGVSAFEALPEDAKEIIARIANGEIQ